MADLVVASPRFLAGFAVLLGAFLAVNAWRQDTTSFGFFHDDSLYFSSAYALAAGKAYVMPSVPGEPSQTKYPVLYPLLLAGVWKLSPQFPDNIHVALWLNALAGCALVAGWVVLMKDLGAGSIETLAAAGISAFHPFTLSVTGAILSDIPFMAFMVWAAVFAGRGGNRWLLAAAACTALAVLTRSIGVAAVGGITLALLHRRAHRKAALVLGLCAPFLLASLWWPPGKPVSIEGLPGYRQTMLFYTSYWEFWKLSVPDLSAAGGMLAANLLEILQAPAVLCFPIQSLSSYASLQTATVLLLSAGIVAGVLRLGRQRGWPPVYFILGCYVAIVALWNYPLANRFLLLFLPLFFLGAFREGASITGAAVRMIRSPAAPVRKLGACALIAGLLLVVIDASRSYLWTIPAQMTQTASVRQTLAREKTELYEWIKTRTRPEERFISYEDASLFLCTGRQAMRPLAFSSEALYRNATTVFERDLEMLTHVARQIQARYWVSSSDDYQLEDGASAIQERTSLLLRNFPVAFRSRGGNVKVYEVSAY